MRRVALVVAPVHLPEYPSLGVATLAASLRRRGHDVDVHHLHVEAAAAVGVPDYDAIASENSWTRNLGEWLFSHPDITPGAADEATMRRFLAGGGVAVAFERLAQLDLGKLRHLFDRLIEKWAVEIPWASYDVVGFTVMFQQLNASLRLARAIKQRAPGTRVVFGGCSMEQPMGDAALARHPFLDAVFSGYADRSLAAWVEALPPRVEQPIVDDGPTDLDELPTPEFDDYLAAIRRHGLHRRIVPRILVETSRGCWYGQKHHCTFCGMNGLQMRFRQKSAERAFVEVQSLSRHGLPLWATDNILPLDYFEKLFPRLARENIRFDTFYEIKSNCTRKQLESLARVGIRRLQPGIESLSTPVLKLMRKGVTGIQNVWFLRAAEELGLGCQWNILWGFPGEEPGEYRMMAALFPRLVHLQAPLGSGRIHLLRFSPNHAQAKELGFVDLRPYASYELAFGRHERLDDQAYFFEYGYADGRDPDRYAREVEEQARRWIAAKRRPFAPRCELFAVGGQQLLVDTRRRGTVGVASPGITRVDDDVRALLDALESPVTRAKLEREWARKIPLGSLLERFRERDWVLEADGRLVRLVVIRPEPSLVAEVRRVAAAKASAFRDAARRRM